MLFVPGHKPSWAQKAGAADADAIILDLEDSVPAADKAAARDAVRETIGRLRELGPRADVWVRPNDYGSGLFGADAEAVMVPGLAGLTGPNADISRELGFEFTPEGLESLAGSLSP
jgi:citrate lyase subunit beta/citryl-CoA lyase